VIKRLRYVPKPIKQGYFVYNEENAQNNLMTDIRWVNDKKGCIKIYKLPNQPEISKYCIGGDTAGDTEGDEFSSDVIDAKSLEQVATLTMQTDEGLYAKQMYCLGKYYEWATIAVETNFSTYPQKKLEELDYPNFYVRETVDRFDKSITHQFGFNTNRKTKPLILAGLVELVRDHTHLFNDEKTLHQMLTFVKKDGGVQEAETGFHDDKVMSVAIAHHAVGQVAFDDDPIIVPPRYAFSAEREMAGGEDYGEEIVPI
jgi:phage terminase large subunit